jgi:UDP-MurNAc hydroxylase
VVEVGESVELVDSGTIVSESERERVIEAYAADRHEEVTRRARRAHVDAARTLMRLRDEYTEKLAHCSLAERVMVPLYFRLAERPQLAVKVDFQSLSVSITGEACEETFYELTAPAWQVDRVLDRALTWEEFSLTFRVRIRRNPDAYQPVLHAFLLLDGPDLSGWCEMTRAIQENRERIEVEYAGQSYSVLRYCPHQGGDLSQGWLEGNCLVCPRHRWHFDLSQNGRCTTNDTSIEAVATGQPAIAANEVAS